MVVKPVQMSFLLVVFTFLFIASVSKAEIATGLVISEIQLAGANAGEDFIEIYNPTSLNINLEDYKLVKRTSTGTADTTVVTFGATDEIPAFGYFLWCNSDITDTLDCDRANSENVSFNNSVALKNVSGTVLDAVTFGIVTNPLAEGTPIASAPPASGSAERKAKSTSTAVTMGPGGEDEFLGNSEDTNNNVNDFVIKTVSQPQNKLSAIENPPEATTSPTISPTLSPSPTESPTPTPEPTVTPTPEPTPTPSSTPTETPTPSPTPTDAPTQTPTPTATPTTEPTPTPTEEPTPNPTPTMSPTVTPSSSPTPTPIISPAPTSSPFPFFPRITPIRFPFEFIVKMMTIHIKILLNFPFFH